MSDTFTPTHYSSLALAVAPYGTKELHIANAIVGEDVEVHQCGARKGVRVGIATAINAASSFRVSPRCIHFPSCGGCTTQHISYEHQLSIKKSFIDQLYRGFEVSPIIYDEGVFQYRNKMEFSFSENKAGEKFLGLIIRFSKGRVVTIRSCELVSPWMNQITQELLEWAIQHKLTVFYPPSGKGTLRTLTLREGLHTKEKMVILTVSGSPEYAITHPQIESLKRIIPSEISLFIKVQQAVRGEPTQFYEMHLHGPAYIHEKVSVLGKEYEFCISPSSFFQPNTKTAQKLFTAIIESAQFSGEEVLLDLYCGTATLGIIASRFVKSVYGVELNKYAIYDGKVNAEKNGCENVHLQAGDAGEILPTLPQADVVIVDPPRTGLGEKVAHFLAKGKASKIVYVSCNPITQAKDIQIFLQDGWKIQKLQPIDQFPHTPHVENIAVLIR